MSKVVARLIIDTDEWDHTSELGESDNVFHLRKVETVKAVPFSDQELGLVFGDFGDEYAV